MSNKDVGVQSFVIVALLGTLASVISTSVAISFSSWRTAPNCGHERAEYSERSFSRGHNVRGPAITLRTSHTIFPSKLR